MLFAFSLAMLLAFSLAMLLAFSLAMLLVFSPAMLLAFSPAMLLVFSPAMLLAFSLAMLLAAERGKVSGRATMLYPTGIETLSGWGAVQNAEKFVPAFILLQFVCMIL
jgi:hypothetical protein